MRRPLPFAAFTTIVVAAVFASAGSAGAVTPIAHRLCDGTVTIELTLVPTNLTARVANVRIVGDQVVFDLEYDWQGDNAPEQVETNRTLPLPPIPDNCAPAATPAPPTTEPPSAAFSFTIRSQCRNDTPYVIYDAQVDGIAAGAPMVLHWVDANGVEQFTQSVTSGSGEVLWPGAEVDAAGDPTDWPGWVETSPGEWIEAPDGFEWARPEVFVFATVNPTSPSLGLSYPPATPRCQADPPDATSNTVSTLPATGADATGALVVTGTLVTLAGAALVAATRARRIG